MPQEKLHLNYKNFPQDVQKLVDAVLAAANPATAVSRHLRKENQTIRLDEHSYEVANGRIFLISAGKAAVPMIQAALTILADFVYAGICITKDSPDLSTPHFPHNIHFYTGEHPVSGEKSVAATTAVYQLLTQTTANDLVLCLISGGCSALLTQPILPLQEWQILNEALLASGCTINEFNAVRRQLDAVKGGGLAQWAAPAQVATLILSDVVGNDLKAIGSGPTIVSNESPNVATAVLDQYHIQQKIPAHIWQTIHTHLQKNSSTEQPPQGQTSIIGDVRLAATALAAAAQKLGFTSQILTTHLQGEAREAGLFAAAIAKDMPPAHCIILGGETTVTIRGNGLGGRNLEMALSAAIGIENLPNAVIFTLATDGDDGPTHCAGAMVCGETVGYGRLQNKNAQIHLNNNDSYTYFQALDNHLIITGPTGTNLNDVTCILTYPP